MAKVGSVSRRSNCVIVPFVVVQRKLPTQLFSLCFWVAWASVEYER